MRPTRADTLRLGSSPTSLLPKSAPPPNHFDRHTDHSTVQNKGDLYENGSNPSVSGADGRRRLGAERGAVAAAGSHAHRSAAARPQRVGTRGDPSARRFRSRGGVSAAQEHTSELQSLTNLVCRLLLEKK